MKNFMGFDGFVWWMGVVEDNNDPEQMGRIRCRIFGIHTEDKEILPTEDLPWAMVMMPATGGSVSGVGQTPSGLMNGSWIMGFFRDGTACQEPVVIGSFPGAPQTRPNTSLGFADPSGQFPREIEEPDVNRLARGLDTATPFVDRRNAIQQVHISEGVPGEIVATRSPYAAPDGSVTYGPKEIPWSDETWVPLNPADVYAPRYPYNKVQETESGHVIELDDTPDSERVVIQHRTGTFVELHPNGSLQIFSANRGEVIIDEHLNIEAMGHVQIFSHDKTTVYANKNIDMESKEDVRIKCKNFRVEAEDTIVEIAGNKIDLDSKYVDIDGSKRIDLN